MHDDAMRLFVSYSRSDAQFVAQLTHALEADGHDVWVDTDDIVGSEQWRASIVAGVQRADAVLLIVSPRSMASPNVEREVTVAAEESRRIVPVVLEHAEMTGSILFVLAGAQQISFAGRPFEVAMQDLRDELRRLPANPLQASPLPPPVVPVSATSSQSKRRLAPVVAIVVVALAAVVIYLVTRGGNDEVAGGTSQAEATVGVATSISATTTGQAALTDVRLDATVWFSGFAISATRVTYDPAAGVVKMSVTFTNDAIGVADPLGMLEFGSSAIEWSGGRITALCACSSQLPAGNSVPSTIDVGVPTDFDLQSAVWVLGGATQHQAKVPLNGDAATSEVPVPYDIQGQIDDGQGTTFTIEKVRVVSADCSGSADRLTYAPGSADQVSVELVGSAVYTGEGNIGWGQATLYVPTGLAIASESLQPFTYVLDPNQPKHNIGVCFVVPAPAAGSYTLVMGDPNATPAPAGFTFQL